MRDRIDEACRRTDRNPGEITLIAVGENVEATRVIEAAQAGIADLGEDRVQEALEKHDVVNEVVEHSLRWHMVGHLHTNMVRNAVEIFDVVHSVDSVRLARELDLRAEQVGRKIAVLIEVNTSGEKSKFGVRLAGLSGFT